MVQSSPPYGLSLRLSVFLTRYFSNSQLSNHQQKSNFPSKARFFASKIKIHQHQENSQIT
jgi:hypothetical protein